MFLFVTVTAEWFFKIKGVTAICSLGEVLSLPLVLTDDITLLFVLVQEGAYGLCSLFRVGPVLNDMNMNTSHGHDYVKEYEDGETLEEEKWRMQGETDNWDEKSE